MGIKAKLKTIAKRLLDEDITVINSDCDRKNFPKALSDFVSNNEYTMSPYSQFGSRKDKKEFYPEIKKIEKGFYLLYKDLHEKYDEENFVQIPEIFTVRTGSPMKTKAFPMAKWFILKMLMGKYLYQYPNIPGHIVARSHFLNYLFREGFQREKEDGYDGLGVDNVVFSCSTTHAFSMILNTIMHDEDVVLMTGPNYGLFAVDPERLNGRVEVIDLREEDGWKLNPEILSKRIDEINNRLKKEFEGKLDYTPKVVAFHNMNPHNPLGKVMNSSHIELIKQIGDVCLEKGVFIIDDLIYRDLTYNQDDLAIPFASIPKYFNTTISLFGLSKSYGLAGIRAGAIVGPIPIMKGIEEKIFTSMDSLPVLQVQALAGAFNGTNKRYRQAKKYFKPIINEYQFRFNVLYALVEGIDVIEDKKLKKKVIKKIKKYSNKKYFNILLNGLDDVCIRSGTIPESGFFAVIDFTKLKGKKYGDDIINNEIDLVQYLYKTVKFKCIMGNNMSWPYDEEMIARFNFGIEISDLIRDFTSLHIALDNEKN